MAPLDVADQEALHGLHLVLVQALHGFRVILLQVEQHAGVHFSQFGLEILHDFDDCIDGIVASFGQGLRARGLPVAGLVKNLEYEVCFVLEIAIEGLFGDPQLCCQIVHAHGTYAKSAKSLFAPFEQVDQAGVFRRSL